MASILSVEQLQGLAAGSTPNTITIPSGQNLDMSNASTFTMPAGRYYVHQVGSDSRVVNNLTYNTSHNGESGTVLATIDDPVVTLTPKNANSIFVVHMHMAIITNNNRTALSPRCEINGTVRSQLANTTNTAATELMGHRYNGHRVQQDGNKHWMSIGYGYYAAVGTGLHTFKMRPYIYNEGAAITINIGGGGSTQIHVMELAQ